MLAELVLLALSSVASGAESSPLPVGIPPHTGKAIARVTDGEDSKSDWTIALTLPRDTWREIQFVMPRLDWPEPTWEAIRPGIREGTMTLNDDSMSTHFTVVDMKGKKLGRDQIMEQLKTKQSVLVSASGRMPHACYLQLPTPAKLIVLLGPGDKQDLTERKIPAEEANGKQDIDLKDWTEEKSQQYFFKLMQKSANFKIKSEEEASKFLQGIWPLDKRAHIGGGHYVRADRGEDVTVSCTDKWLVVTALSGGDAKDLAVARVERVETDERGHLHAKTKSSSKEISLRKIYEFNTEGKTNFKNAAINIAENQDAITVTQWSLENQFLPVDIEGSERNPIELVDWSFPVLIPGSNRIIAARKDTISVLEPLNQLNVVGTMPHVMQADDFVLPAVSPNGKVICTRAKLDHLQLFDAQTARPVTAPIRQTGRVLVMRFTSDSKYLCSRAEDKPADFDSDNSRRNRKTNPGGDGLRVWDPQTGELVATFGNDVSSAVVGWPAYDPISERIVTVENSGFDVAELSGRLLVHSIKGNGQAMKTIEIPAHTIGVRWIDSDHLLVWGGRKESPEIRRDLGAYDTKPLFVVSLAKGKNTVELLAEHCVSHPETAPDGKYIAATVKTADGPRATCWRVGQMEPLWEHPRNIVAFGDSGWVATEQRGGISQIRLLHDGRVIWQREGVLEAQVQGKNLWLFTARGYEVWQADWGEKKP